MSMKPFSDLQVGVKELKPGGCDQPGLGFWMRTSDQAFFFQRGIPNMTAEQIKVGLLPNVRPAHSARTNGAV